MEPVRKFPRARISIPVDFRISGKEPFREKCFTRVLGGGGLMMTTATHLPAGTRVEMNLYHDSFVIPCEAEVVWIDPSAKADASEYRCGFQFLTDSNNGLMHIQHLLQSTLGNS